MSGVRHLVFPPYSLDTANYCLWRDNKGIPLRPKTFGVLRYLLEHPDRLVSKEELLDSVWKGTRVIDAVLKVIIRELRQILSDDVKAPRFIKSVGRLGYRFIAPIAIQSAQSNYSGSITVPFVGRQAELEQLQRCLELANSGERQIVFVTGEPGIGKTTLAETFTSTFADDDHIVTAHGQCIEQYGVGEAYLPILDALERLGGRSNKDEIKELLCRYAPSWLLNLPALTSPAERSELQRECAGTAPERRLREIAGFLEALARERTVLLILEDMHWLDPSTLTLISYLAHRREAARLMLIGTYRQHEVERLRYPLKTVEVELELHNRCVRLPLDVLSRTAVREYLAARFDTEAIPYNFVSEVYRRSEGNPLFMVNVTDQLVSRASIVRENGAVKFIEMKERYEVPQPTRDLIERQIVALGQDDRMLLETASVAGITFSVALIARALGYNREETENRFRDLAARTNLLQYVGFRRRPNRRGTPVYSFTHEVYQNVIYGRNTEAHRARLHHIIGERIEAAHVGATELVAVELADHFERAGDYERGVRYTLQAARTSMNELTRWFSLSALLKARIPEKLNHFDRSTPFLRASGDARNSTSARLVLATFLAAQSDARRLSKTVDNDISMTADKVKKRSHRQRHYLRAEFDCFRGERLIKKKGYFSKSSFKQAKAFFVNAIVVAKHQKARSLELRATIGLVSAWQKAGESVKAQKFLTRIVNSFNNRLQAEVRVITHL